MDLFNFFLSCCEVFWGLSTLGLQSITLCNVLALFQSINDLFDIESLGENRFVLRQKIMNPFLCLKWQSCYLFCINISIIVKNCQFILGWLFFMLENKLLDVFTPIKELLFILYIECWFSSFFPILAFNISQWSYCKRMYLYLMLKVL